MLPQGDGHLLVAEVFGADVVEIVPDSNGVLTPFTAALIATRLVGGHLSTRIR